MKKRNLSFCLLVLVFLLTVSTLLCGASVGDICPSCGGLCRFEESGIDHEECLHCGKKCHYESGTPTVCFYCRAACTGLTWEHKTCPNCQGACDGSGYQHIPCPGCGAQCTVEGSYPVYFYDHAPDCPGPDSSSSAPTSSSQPNNPAPSSPSSRPYEGPTDVTVVAPEKEVPATGSDPFVTVIVAANVAVVAALAVVLFRKKSSDR